MYTNIGLRNHQAVIRNGHQVVENWNDKNKLGDYRDDALKAAAVKYGEMLLDLDLLFKSMNLLVNR